MLMPHYMARIALLMIIALLSACGTGCSSQDEGKEQATSSTNSVMRLPARLQREGRWMVDSQNRIVLLHGVNAVWKLAPYFAPNDPAGFTAADADWLKEHGFNSVRLGVLFSGVMPKQGVIDTDYLRQTDRVVQLLASRGIWVLFDFHQDLYSERFGGEGFPDWAVYDDGVPNPFDAGFPANYIMPGTMRTFDNLWANRNGIWDDYRDAWMAVARQWASQPYSMGYDLINEPHPGSSAFICYTPFLGCQDFDSNKLQAFQSHVMAGIRQVDPKNLVWFEPNVNFSTGPGIPTQLGTLTPLVDANLGFSWHNYCSQAALLHAYGATDVPGCEQEHSSVFDLAETAVTRLGATTLVSEFGASDDLPDIRQVADQADQRLTSWQYWHYKGWNDPTSEDPTGAVQSLFEHDDDLSSVKMGKLKILERAYPQATAGMPLALSFNIDNATFSYRYKPRTAGAPTEIHMPALHYPKGYRVTVSGGRVISAANARTLVIENLPAAVEVNVEATPLP